MAAAPSRASAVSSLKSLVLKMETFKLSSFNGKPPLPFGLGHTVLPEQGSRQACMRALQE
jgi:hypothetical protein